MHIGYAEVQISTPEKIENGEFFLYDGALVVKKMSSLAHGGRQPLNSTTSISGPHVVVRVALEGNTQLNCSPNIHCPD